MRNELNQVHNVAWVFRVIFRSFWCHDHKLDNKEYRLADLTYNQCNKRGWSECKQKCKRKNKKTVIKNLLAREEVSG